MLGALQQPFVKVSGVPELLLLDLKVDVGLPQHLETERTNEKQNEPQLYRTDQIMKRREEMSKPPPVTMVTLMFVH